MSKSTKLSQKQISLYRVRTIDNLKGIYTLKDIDRAKLKGTFSSNRLKKFVKQDQYFRVLDKEVINVIEEERQRVIKEETR